MKKWIIIILLTIILIFIIIWYLDKYFNTNNFLKTDKLNKDIIIADNNVNNKGGEDSAMQTITNIKVIIDGKKYDAKIEDNETAQTFINSLPQEFNMNELNGNEKYIYMDSCLPTNSSTPRHIESGDIMLYGDNCLVIFYKSFDTNYSYTRIGHIEGLTNLGSGSIISRFEK